MRRKDREVKEFHKIKDIIEACQCCRLGLCDDGKVYIVPLNFGYTFENKQWTLYFHSAKVGHKIDLMKKNQYVGFEMDTNYQLKEGTFACQYSSYYQSIIGQGRISFIDDLSQKEKALSLIMEHYTHQSDWEFSKDMMDAVCIFQLVVDEMSCKENIDG